MENIIITYNAGSSNIKISLFNADSMERVENVRLNNQKEAFDWLTSVSKEDTGRNILAVGHRVVHGGDKFIAPQIIDEKIISELEKFIPLAPLHQPASIEAIKKMKELFPKIPHIACFDTAFHHTIIDVEKRFAIPREYHDKGVRRYGFHGLSYEHIISVLPEYIGDLADERVIVAHLGGGSSICAICDKKSIGISMGFSTLDGLMMSSRCGSLDAGVVLHMMEQENMTAREISDMLYHKSGCLGVSGGLSADMKELIIKGTKEAIEAIDLYSYIAAKKLASLLPSIGGIDVLVFTGGIGENSDVIRQRICSYLSWVDDVPVYVIPTDEESVIARACADITGLRAAV
ncbi:MAG: acetate kinase [Rickettsiales bacterium]